MDIIDIMTSFTNENVKNNDIIRDAGRMKGQGGQLFNKGHFFNKYIFPTYTFV